MSRVLLLTIVLVMVTVVSQPAHAGSIALAEWSMRRPTSRAPGLNEPGFRVVYSAWIQALPGEQSVAVSPADFRALQLAGANASAWSDSIIEGPADSAGRRNLIYPSPLAGSSNPSRLYGLGFRPPGSAGDTLNIMRRNPLETGRADFVEAYAAALERIRRLLLDSRTPVITLVSAIDSAISGGRPAGASERAIGRLYHLRALAVFHAPSSRRDTIAAMAALEELSKLDTDLPGLAGDRGLLKYFTQDFAGACRDLEVAARTMPEVETLLLLVRSARRIGDTGAIEAGTIAARVLMKSPDLSAIDRGFLRQEFSILTDVIEP